MAIKNNDKVEGLVVETASPTTRAEKDDKVCLVTPNEGTTLVPEHGTLVQVTSSPWSTVGFASDTYAAIVREWTLAQDVLTQMYPSSCARDADDPDVLARCSIVKKHGAQHTIALAMTKIPTPAL